MYNSEQACYLGALLGHVCPMCPFCWQWKQTRSATSTKLCESGRFLINGLFLSCDDGDVVAGAHLLVRDVRTSELLYLALTLW